MDKFVQNIEELQNHYNTKEIENKKYRGRIPKKKRIRNKIQKQRENKVYMLDEYHIIGVNNNNKPILAPKDIDHKDMQIIGTSGTSQEQHYDGNGNRL